MKDSLASLFVVFAKSDEETIIVFQMVVQSNRSFPLLKQIGEARFRIKLRVKKTIPRADRTSQSGITSHSPLWYLDAQTRENAICSRSLECNCHGLEFWFVSPASSFKATQTNPQHSLLCCAQTRQTLEITQAKLPPCFHLPTKSFQLFIIFHWGKLLPGETTREFYQSWPRVWDAEVRKNRERGR